MSILEEPIKEVKVIKNYINGKWIDPENNGYLDVENPATREIIARVPLSTTKETNRAIDAAADAYPGWSATPVARRVRPLFKLNDLLRACLLYTSDAADEEDSVDLGGRRILK